MTSDEDRTSRCRARARDGTRRGSVLELMHPRSRADRTLVLGSACPPSLDPGRGDQRTEVDLVLIAPTRDEWRRDWLDEALAVAAAALTPDGVVYALTRRRGRRGLQQAASVHGLVCEESFLHVPDGRSSRYIIPAERLPALYAVSQLMWAAPRSRNLAGRILRRRWSNGLLRFTAIGIALRHPNAPPLYTWLSETVGEAAPRIVLVSSWRGSGPLTLHVLPAGSSSPLAIAKVALDPNDAPNIANEGNLLRRLAASARRKDVEVPEVIASTGAVWPLILQTALPGELAASGLAGDWRTALQTIRRLAEWIEEWNQDTAIVTHVDLAFFEREILDPARSLMQRLPDGHAYYAWLAARCRALVGTQVPLVAAHGDLTMWNVRLDDQGSIGIFDWNTAREDALPLMDFVFAATDAAAAVARYENRVAAFEDCFSSDGRYASIVGGLGERLRGVLALSTEFGELCIHACWLQAAHRAQKAREGDVHQFFEIVERLANHARRGSQISI